MRNEEEGQDAERRISPLCVSAVIPGWRALCAVSGPWILGGMTIRSIGHIAQLQMIDDDNEDLVSPEVMIAHLIKDNLHMARQLRAAIEACDRARDAATSSILETILDETEKRVWFLFEISQGGEHME